MRIHQGLMGAGLMLAVASGVTAEYFLTPEATREIQGLLATGEWSIRTSWPLATDHDYRAADQPVEFIPITVHVVRFDSGTGGIDLALVDQAIAVCNQQYNNPDSGYFGYRFYRKNVQFIDSDEFAYFHMDFYGSSELGALIQENPIPGTVNAYFVPEFQSDRPIAGVSTLPYGPGAKGMALSNTGTGALPHEMGHYLGLLHTFEWNANGDECASGDGCEFGGDLICETPADPGTGWWGNFRAAPLAYCYRCDTDFSHPYDPQGNDGRGELGEVDCPWANVDCDDRGADCGTGYAHCEADDGETCIQYEPMTNNIMSYYDPGDPSTSRFVAEQLSLMRATLEFRFADHVESDFDCNGNDLPDSFEIESLWYPDSVDCDANGRPDDCDIADNLALDCDSDGRIDHCQLSGGYDTDCDGNGELDSCDLIDDPSLDCDFNGLFDICQIQQGDGTDCDGNGLMDACDVAADPSLDCDGSGLFDLCEIALGISTDCDGSGVPDHCELAENPERDCDGNGVYDPCDVDSGLDTDCDGNGRLDNCDLAIDPARDCDLDGVIDACAIANGDVDDCDGSGLPDSCEGTLASVTDRLTDADPDWHAYLGTSASIYGGMAVVGSPGDDSGAAQGGAVTVYRRQSPGVWSAETELLDAASAKNDLMGSAVAAGDGEVFSGAPGDNNAMGVDAGAVIVHTRTEGMWSQGATLYGSATNVDDEFGGSLALDGDRLAVGAPMGEPTEVIGAAGMVYIFGRSGETWAEQHILSHSGGDEGDGFGHSVSLDGDTLAVGMPGYDGAALNAGGAAIMDASGSGVVATLVDPAAKPHDAFGTSVSVQGVWAAVGSPLSNPAGPTDSGSVSIFKMVSGDWAWQQTLVASDARAGDRFGSQVVLDGERLMVGSPYDDGIEPILGNSGQVYTFVLDGGAWSESGVVQPFQREIGLQFGHAVDAMGGLSIVGAPGAVGEFDDVGAAFVVVLLDCDLNGEVDSCELADGGSDCDLDGVLDSCGIAMALARDCDGNGQPDSCDIVGDPGLDSNGNGELDACEGLGDLAGGDGIINLADLMVMISFWGTSNGAADLDGDGIVGVRDLILLLERWGTAG